MALRARAHLRGEPQNGIRVLRRDVSQRTVRLNRFMGEFRAAGRLGEAEEKKTGGDWVSPFSVKQGEAKLSAR